MRVLWILFLAFFLPCLSLAQSSTVNQAVLLKNMLIQNHVSPRAIDDQYSADVFATFIDQLDPQRIYFTEAEIRQLQVHQLKLDDQLKGSPWTFLPLATSIFKNALTRAANTLTSRSKIPVDVRIKEQVENDTAWAVHENELTDRWRLMMKREVMQELAIQFVGQKVLNEADFISRHEPLVRERMAQKNMARINKLLRHAMGFDEYMNTLFLRALSSTFDPHSLYMAPYQMQNFIASLSTEGYYFGFDVEENEQGEMVITALFPGGPAWKSGQINTGDVLEKIRWEGKEWMTLTGISEDDLDDLLKESNHNRLELLLRKQGSLYKSVLLRKEILDSEENIVRSFLLEGKRKIGYIVLPDFYSTWGESDGSRCASDVAKEILKLKKENIEGLILDLRFNGGGSLNEAVSMAGIFIDAGPVGIVKTNGKEPVTIKDMNRGTVYDGPLVVLVNGLSASASEFLASALQDYRRAIIVGSPTYGKAVAQEMFSLEPGKPGVDFNKIKSQLNWGYTTITTSKIYRVNGRSIQQNGVMPDVALPDLTALYPTRESDMPFALASDSITKKVYNQPLGLMPLPELQEKSRTRVGVHAGFIALNEFLGRETAEEIDGGVLEWIIEKQDAQDRLRNYSLLDKITHTQTSSYQINTHAFGKSRMELDEFAESVSKAWIKNISTDITLEETFHVICDYIETLHRN